MFQNCLKLTNIQSSNMSSNVSNAKYMFMSSCTSLNNNSILNIENFFSSSLITT